MKLAIALSAAQEGQERAQSMSVHCGIAIVDAAAATLVLLRHESASMFMAQTSQSKAVAACAFKMSGAEMEIAAKTNAARSAGVIATAAQCECSLSKHCSVALC